MNLELATAVDAENPDRGDLRLTNGQLTLVDESDAIRQHLTNRLRFFLREWFLDRRLGIPYFSEVLVKNPNRPAVRSIFRRTIRETPGIASVDELLLTIGSDRSARLDFTAALDQSGEELVFSEFILGVP
jgi:hypothetical protein